MEACLTEKWGQRTFWNHLSILLWDMRQYEWASLVAQTVKNAPAMREAWVRSPGWEDPLEEGMATRSCSRIIHWRESLGRWGETGNVVQRTENRLHDVFFSLKTLILAWKGLLISLFIFIYFWPCWSLRRTQAFSRCFSSLQGVGLLTAVASLAVAPGLEGTGPAAAAHGLSCSVACGIFPSQGWNLCPLHWQGDSQPPDHKGSPWRL